MDFDSCVLDADNQKSWRSPHEQPQHWRNEQEEVGMLANLLIHYC